MTKALVQLAERLRDARSVTVLTGAGVSAASGVPTFRGAGGLWRNYSATDLATPDAFARDPELVWEWYAWRRSQVAACEPNVAHHVLARWTQRHDRWRVVTQNVDDLLVRAGTRGLVRLHGSIFELRCWNECAESANGWRDERVPFAEMPPRCPHCGGLARPGVVWFGESLDPADVDEEFLQTVAHTPKVCPHIHLALQAGGNATLRRMRRRYTSELFLKWARRWREIG